MENELEQWAVAVDKTLDLIVKQQEQLTKQLEETVRLLETIINDLKRRP